MKNIINWVKEHPLMTVLFIGLGVLLILVLNSGGSSSSGSYAGGPSDASVAAAAALQAKGIDASIQSSAIQASFAAKQIDSATALALATIQSDVAKYNTASGAQVSLAGIAAQQSIQMAGIQSQTTLADLNFKTEMARIYSNVEMANITAMTYTSISNAQANIRMTEINRAADIQMAPYTTVQKFYEIIGGDNLTKLIYGAEGTKGSTLLLPGGIAAGRVGSSGGSLFGNSFGDSSFSGLIGNVAKAVTGYGFQAGKIGTGVIGF